MDDRHGMPGYTVRDRRWWARGEEEGVGEERGDKPTYVAQLEAELAETRRQLAEALARERLALDEQEHARHRVEREARREIARSRKQVILELLPVLDDLDRALAAADRSNDAGALRRGVELVRAGFLDRLRGLGVERDVPTGQPFDPARHEAVSIVPGRVNGSVCETVSPGYLLEDEVLRPARVVVSQADRNAETDYPAAR